MSRREIWFAITHSGTGGAHLVTLNIARAFEERGYPVAVVGLFPSSSQGVDSPANAPWLHVAEDKPRSPAALARMGTDLVRLIRTRRPAVIFSALPAANALLPISAALANVGTRCITIHHTEVSTHSRLSRMLDRFIGGSGFVERIVCVSNAVRSSLHDRSTAYQRKTLTIHNALEREVAGRIRALAAHRATSHRTGRVVVATGRLARQKNYETLLRAFVAVPDATLRIVGKGPEAEPLQALARTLHIADRVEFMGFRPHGETLGLIADADLFVQPSLFEGHSMALLEAALMGLPMVISDTPAQREAMTRADGVLCADTVAPTDVDGLAASIRRLLDDPSEAQRLGVLAQACAEEYAFEHMIAGYAALVERHPGGRRAYGSAPASLSVPQ